MSKMTKRSSDGSDEVFVEIESSVCASWDQALEERYPYLEMLFFFSFCISAIVFMFLSQLYGTF